MSRKLATADELQQLVQGRLDNSTDLDGDCRGVIVNAVSWHEPDDTGCNWSIEHFTGDPGCTGVVMAIVSDLRKQFNLKEE